MADLDTKKLMVCPYCGYQNKDFWEFYHQGFEWFGTEEAPGKEKVGGTFSGIEVYCEECHEGFVDNFKWEYVSGGRIKT